MCGRICVVIVFAVGAAVFLVLSIYAVAGELCRSGLVALC